jgi:nucleoside-diphosphate-sugar epimerase
MPTACVTGASGMIGRRIVRALLQRGHGVRILTRREVQVAGVEIFRADLADDQVLERFVAGASAVFHCAAELRDESRMRDVNVLGTRRIVQLVERHGVGYFCQMSSAGVVGRTTRDWIDESAPCNPQNAYEVTKLEAERIAERGVAGCTTVILRPTNVVDETHLGELQLPVDGSLRSRMKAFVKGGECAHIVHAEDVAEAAVHFLDRPSGDPRVFFVSLDHDPLNTVANLWRLHRALSGGRSGRELSPFPHLPAAVPHFLRRLTSGRGNRGTIRYASDRLLSQGFRYSLGVADAVQRILQDRAWL